MATLTLMPLSTAPQVRTRTVLTRRGRRVLGATLASGVFFLAYAVAGLVGAFVHAASEPAAPIATQTVVIRPGTTLWQLAKQLDPSGDPRAMVDRIAELNGLTDGAILIAGQTLVVPANS